MSICLNDSNCELMMCYSRCLLLTNRGALGQCLTVLVAGERSHDGWLRGQKWVAAAKLKRWVVMALPVVDQSGGVMRFCGAALGAIMMLCKLVTPLAN